MRLGHDNYVMVEQTYRQYLDEALAQNFPEIAAQLSERRTDTKPSE